MSWRRLAIMLGSVVLGGFVNVLIWNLITGYTIWVLWFDGAPAGLMVWLVMDTQGRLTALERYVTWLAQNKEDKEAVHE